MSKTKKTLEKIQLPLTVALIVYIFADNVDVALLFTKMFSIQITHIFICTMLSILTTAVLAHRMRFLASFLGVHLTNRTAYVSIITAQFYSNFISQIFAHVIARDNLYSRAGGSSINLAFLTLLEKLLSAFIIVIFAVFWASQIFNVKLFDTVFQKVNFYEFCSIIICVVASLVVVKFKAPKFRRFSIKKMRTRPFLGSILCTIISYIFVVSIFVVLCWSLKPESETTELLYFATIIMFCASIPVTINGWGTRELSSIYFLNQLGFENSEALAISITVGLIFTAVSIGLFLIAPSSRAAKKTLDKNHSELQTNKLNSLDRAVTYWFTSLAAVLIFFQFHVNVGGQVLNINFADPLAILALCVVLLWCLKTRLPPIWTINRLNLFLVSFLLTTAVALAVGFLTYGSNDWAIFNRALGYFVLLGYASFGVIVMGSQNIYGVKRLLETMSFTAISIIFITTFCNLTLDTKHHFAFGEFRGFAGNENAFALQLLLVFCAAISFNFGISSKSSQRVFGCQFNKVKETHYSSLVAPSLIIFGLFQTNSLAAYICLIAIVLVSLKLKFLTQKTFFKVSACSLALLAVLMIIHQLDPAAVSPNASATVFNASADKFSNTINLDNNIDRFTGYWDAFKLWSKNPLLGIGLGGFYQFSIENYSHPDVIHNTALWILVEYGLVSFLFILSISILLINQIFLLDRFLPRAKLALLFIVSVLMFSLVHEIFYQRLVWMFLGLIFATSSLGRRAQRMAKN